MPRPLTSSSGITSTIQEEVPKTEKLLDTTTLDADTKMIYKVLEQTKEIKDSCNNGNDTSENAIPRVTLASRNRKEAHKLLIM